VDLVYERRGAGRPVLLIHDMAADHLALLPLADAIAAGGDADVIAYSRRGYGGSGSPEPYLGTTVAEQSRDAVSLLDALSARDAVGVGSGFGALVVLNLLINEPGALSAGLLADPPLLAFAPDGARELSDQHARLAEAVAAGGPGAGVRSWLGGLADDAALARALNAQRAFFADWAGLASLALTRADLRAITEPVALVTGPDTSSAVSQATSALEQLLPRATRRTDGDLAAAARAILAR